MKVIFNNHTDSIQTEKNNIINVRIISYLVSSESYTFNYKVQKSEVINPSLQNTVLNYCTYLNGKVENVIDTKE